MGGGPSLPLRGIFPSHPFPAVRVCGGGGGEGGASLLFPITFSPSSSLQVGRRPWHYACLKPRYSARKVTFEGRGAWEGEREGGEAHVRGGGRGGGGGGGGRGAWKGGRERGSHGKEDGRKEGREGGREVGRAVRCWQFVLGLWRSEHVQRGSRPFF